MSLSLPKIVVATLLGITFLLCGLEVVSAATPQYYLLSYTKDARPATGSASAPFASLTECSAAQKALPSSLIGYCAMYSSQQQAQDVMNLQVAATNANLKKNSGPSALENFNCGVPLVSGSDASITACIPVGIYYLIYKPVAVIFMGTGYLFDMILDLSIKKEFVDRPFINSSWKVMRDFSNMLFIFVLLYTGIQTILGTPGWAKTVRNVIIIALLINFSLFFTKVVIDAGNVLAGGVSEAIKAGSPSISKGLVRNFEPQAFLDKTGELKDAMDAVVIFIIAAIINGYAAYIFFKAALLFMGRLIAFWFLMIVSPFAFISITLPKGNVFNKWWKTLLDQAFVAPVYLFLIYLILQIINSEGVGLLGGANLGVVSGSFIFDKLIAPIIMATLILFALQQSLKFAEKMAGDFGAMGAKMAGAVMGATVAGAAVTGVGAISALSSFGGKFAGRGGVLGAIGDASAKVGHAGRNLTFDARNIAIPLVGGTVGSHSGAGAGRTSTLETTKAEAVKRAEEKAKRAAEKPESIEQALAKAAAKRREDQALKDATAAQMTPDEVADMELREARNEAERIDKADTATKEAEKEVRAATEAERVAKEAHDESETAKIIKALQEGFTKASKAGNVGEATKLAESLKAAKEAHATSETGLKLEAAKVTLKKSTENYTEAVKSRAEAEKHTATLIEEENKNRANVHAREAEARGRYDTAAKIRKGEKGGKKTAKELVEELMKETGEKVEEPKK